MLLALLLSTAWTARPAHADEAPPLKVVTSLTTYGAIAREIVGDHGTVTSIAQGDEDPHFVQPKPSFVAVLREDHVVVPRGDTTFQAGDEVIALVTPDSEDEIRRMLTGK